MSDLNTFQQAMEEGYTSKGDFLKIGAPMLNDDEIATGTFIKIPLKMLNRHGLVAGATGTGKTKTVQVIAEAMSENSIPVLLMDLKGDLSGLAAAGSDHPKITDRHNRIGFDYEPCPFPVELLSLSDEKGARLRATVTEFGPVLLSKILELNDTQSSIMSIIFKFCDDKGLPLLDLKDLRKVIQYMNEEGKEEVKNEYGSISSASIGTILRKLIELEQQGADKFFGETSFDPEDLLRIDNKGRGLISIIRLTDIQDRPKLFSTFMLSLLAEIYGTFPEQGDADRPKLCIFIDEAHLIFNEASKALLDQIESIIKLIRSKGVGIFFATQNPSDIPDSVLGQLGLKAQHALRAFTAKDRKMIKLTAQNYPISDFYETDELLTSLGIGEAAVTVLDEKGRPTPLARTLLRAPRSRMGILDNGEMDDLLSKSKLVKKYNKEIDRESAYEMLTEKLTKEAAEQAEAEKEAPKQESRSRKSEPKEEGFFEAMSKNTMFRQMGRTVMREVTRGLLGAITGKKPRSTSRKSGGWF